MIRPSPTEERRLLLTVSAALTKVTINPSTGLSSTVGELITTPRWAGVVLTTRLVFTLSRSWSCGGGGGPGTVVEGPGEAANWVVDVASRVVVVVVELDDVVVGKLVVVEVLEVEVEVGGLEVVVAEVVVVEGGLVVVVVAMVVVVDVVVVDVVVVVGGGSTLLSLSLV